MNKQNPTTEYYSTRDIYVASAILATGLFPIYTINKEGKIYYFVFMYSSPYEIRPDDVVIQYWNGDLVIEAKKLFSAFKEIKNRMYGEGK